MRSETLSSAISVTQRHLAAGGGDRELIPFICTKQNTISLSRTKMACDELVRTTAPKQRLTSSHLVVSRPITLCASPVRRVSPQENTRLHLLLMCLCCQTSNSFSDMNLVVYNILQCNCAFNVSGNIHIHTFKPPPHTFPLFRKFMTK